MKWYGRALLFSSFLLVGIAGVQAGSRVHNSTITIQKIIPQNKPSPMASVIKKVSFSPVQSLAGSQRLQSWSLSGRHGLLDWSVSSGFLSYTGYSYYSHLPDFTAPAYLATVRIQPMAGHYRWQAFAVEMGGSLVTQQMNSSSLGQSFRPFTYHFGLGADLIEAIKGEPRPLRVYVSGGVSNSRPNPVALPDLESFIPYVGTEVSYQIDRHVSAKAGLTYVPVSFGALTSTNTLLFVPNMSLNWGF